MNTKHLKYSRLLKVEKHLFVWLFMFLCACSHLKSQTIYSEQEMIASALNFHPKKKSAELMVQSKKENEKTAFALPGPNIYTQSPSGTFYTIGINQNIDFPLVYSRQKKVYQAETSLAQSQLQLTTQEIIWQVKSLYNLAQFETTKLRNSYIQDSIYAAIALATSSQFNSGEIDFVTMRFAQVQYENIHQEFLQQQINTETILQNLSMFCNLQEELDVLPYSMNQLIKNSPVELEVKSTNAQLAIAQKEYAIAESKIKLEKSKALPSFQFGYLNQVAKNSLVQYRFQAGITLPLWWWQYAGKIKSAKSNAEMTKQQEESVKLNYKIQLYDANQKLITFQNQLQYFIDFGLTNLDELERAATKFYTAGETDLISFLRTLNEVHMLRSKSVEAAHDYIDALNMIQYIQGNNE